MNQQPRPKTAVALIRETFRARGSDIKAKEAYHLLAKLWGYKDWPTARAALKQQEQPKPVFHHVTGTLEDWPVWVFCNQGGTEEDPMYVYPYGTRLDNLYGSRRHWSLIDDRKTVALEVPDDMLTPSELKRLHELFVGEEVACEYPDSDEYGFPTAANEREVHEFLQYELGWGHLADGQARSLVDVQSRCRGDDGMTEWWVQARVHPSVHERLLAATSEEKMAQAKAAQQAQA